MATIQERGLCALAMKAEAGQWTIETRVRSNEVSITNSNGIGIVIRGHETLESLSYAVGKILRETENPDYL